MAERMNFLIGYGERLASDLAAPLGGAPKKHPYSFAEARKRLAPKVRDAAQQLGRLPQAVCPKDQTVALVTLHPTYLAKSYYPADLLRAYGLETVGSRAREVSPGKWAKKNPPASALTSELYVAGPRSRFNQLAVDIDSLRENAAGANDIIKIEDFRAQPTNDKLKPFRSQDKEPLLEIVLHAHPTPADAFILEGFEAYLKTLHLSLNSNLRRFFAEGLCFIPLRVPRELASEVARFSFLRMAREMPRLRQFRPVARATPGFSPFICRLPQEGPVDREIRVAIFDGGVKDDAKLEPWVSVKDTKDLGAPVEEFQNHGTAVTSALLFGPLQDGVIADRPYASVDHYRVLDENTMSDDQAELYSVLDRIQNILNSPPKYDFINISLVLCQRKMLGYGSSPHGSG